MADGYWVQTFTGRQVSFSQPRAEDICLEDVAHALSLQCRFNGHVTKFYSVAQHSVLVADYCQRPEAALLALLHDAAEAYTGDLVRPLKKMLDDPLALLELHLNRVICDALVPEGHRLRRFYHGLGTGLTLHERVDIETAIEHADLVALATERRDLLAHQPDWQMTLPEPAAQKIYPLPPDAARELFLERYYELTQPTKGRAA